MTALDPLHRGNADKRRVVGHVPPSPETPLPWTGGRASALKGQMQRGRANERDACARAVCTWRNHRLRWLAASAIVALIAAVFSFGFVAPSLVCIQSLIKLSSFSLTRPTYREISCMLSIGIETSAFDQHIIYNPPRPPLPSPATPPFSFPPLLHPLLLLSSPTLSLFLPSLALRTLLCSLSRLVPRQRLRTSPSVASRPRRRTSPSVASTD